MKLPLQINRSWQPRVAATATRVPSSSIPRVHIRRPSQLARNKIAWNLQGLKDNSRMRSYGLNCLHQTSFMHAPIRRPQCEMTGQVPYSTKAAIPQEPTIHSIFEEKTGTWQYVVADSSTRDAVIIDPVLDYDPATQIVSARTADSLLSLTEEMGYNIVRILETHAHADHLTAASYLQDHLTRRQGHRPPICIGKRIQGVQRLFSQVYDIPANEYEGVFDKLLDDDETFDIGNLRATAIHLPGHTPDHLGYKIGDNVFCGDSIFHADIGTARCDFPGGNAHDLFNSARKLLGLPDHVKIWTGHDYPPEERGTPVPWMTVHDHKKNNRHLEDGITEEEFVAMRRERDAKLGEPRLLHQSLQVNIRAGHRPKPTISGQSLLRLPLKLKGVEW
ncbi:putative metallo-beta-lactamase protein [Coleophoma crateriformis]|uniref:Putative metallo-beta-lactamase protein n=1 Tax=Coleophoma crateriformis TaxID=565419 RepID=A0A3D8QZ50_9HELO|nr:putative metallo-beta-lactamase protein [Coleophoma crateriformis]